MYYITVGGSFASAHNLRNYRGKCEALHGHNWKIKITMKGLKLDDIGMLMDFKLLKEWMNGIIEELDHTYLNELDYFKKINPTSENMAQYIYDCIAVLAETYTTVPVSVHHVKVWENDTSVATYER